jgi:hypothetical protein
VLILEEKIHVREILVEVYIRLIKTFLDLLLLELQATGMVALNLDILGISF